MNPVIATAISALPAGSEAPRPRSYDIPDAFHVDGDSLRFRVHVRINTHDYRAGWLSSAARERWESDCELLLKEIGFNKCDGWFYPSDGTKHEYLHAHPDSIAGVITVDRIQQLHAAIAGGSFGFSNRWVDVYEVYEELSETELSRRLVHYETAIRDLLLDASQTTRQNKFKAIDGECLATTLPGLSLLGEKVIGGYVSCAGFAIEQISAFVGAIQKQLISEDLLFVHHQNNHTYYRTANKTEQRAMKLKRAG